MPVLNESRFQIDTRSAVRVLPFSAPAFITCAVAGDMGPPELGETDARHTALTAAGLSGYRLLTVKQEHTLTVLDAEAVAAKLSAGPETALRPVADGIAGDAAGAPGHVLGVTVADCMPIYLHDREHGAVAMLHSGWKGTGILLSALRRMEERWGTRANATEVLLGPAIQACCYEVDAERAEGFQRTFGERAAVRRGGRWYLDLQYANRKLAEEAGVRDLAVCTNCTCCGDGLFSYRRDGPSGYRRMLAGIAVE